jgi:hypothetical protein
MTYFRAGTQTARARAKAFAEVECTLERPEASSGPTFVHLKPGAVQTRHELFQPREYVFSKAGLDSRYVSKLKTLIKTKGELEPILVVRLGEKWVCVDGHHRVAAYNGLSWSAAIKCEWFAGSLREAVDESYRRNEIIKLEIPREDKYEEAWKRVVLGWGSKADIVKLCGVSGTLVSQMRRVKRRYEEDTDDLAAQFRERLAPRRLDEVSWSRARMTYLDLEPKEINKREEAERLAKSLRSRHTDTLSRDPKVTAQALALYDPLLPGPLLEELARVKEGTDRDGQLPGPPGETSSDRTWRQWVEAAEDD